MSIIVKGMEMPTNCDNCWALDDYGDYPRCRITEEQRGYNFPIREKRMDNCPLVPVPPHGSLKKRVVYRGDVFNALESARIIALDGILTDRYKDGFHDGLKRALEILANEVQDVPTIIPASEEKT